MSEPAVPPDTSNNVVAAESHENKTTLEDNAIELSAKQKKDLEKKQKEDEKKKQKEEKKKQKEEEKLRKKQEKQQRKAEKKAKKEGKTEVVPPPVQTEEIKIDEEPDEEKDQEEPAQIQEADAEHEDIEQDKKPIEKMGLAAKMELIRRVSLVYVRTCRRPVLEASILYTRELIVKEYQAKARKNQYFRTEGDEGCSLNYFEPRSHERAEFYDIDIEFEFLESLMNELQDAIRASMPIADVKKNMAALTEGSDDKKENDIMFADKTLDDFLYDPPYFVPTIHLQMQNTHDFLRVEAEEKIQQLPAISEKNEDLDDYNSGKGYDRKNSYTVDRVSPPGRVLFSMFGQNVKNMSKKEKRLYVLMRHKLVALQIEASQTKEGSVTDNTQQGVGSGVKYITNENEIIRIRDIREVTFVWLRKKPEDVPYLRIRSTGFKKLEMCIVFEDPTHREIFLTHLRDSYEAFVGPLIITHEPRYLRLVQNDFVPLITGEELPLTRPPKEHFRNAPTVLTKPPKPLRLNQSIYESVLMFIERDIKEIYFASTITFAEYKDHIVGGEKGVIVVTDKGIFFIDQKYSYHRVETKRVLEIIIDRADNPAMLLFISSKYPTEMHVKFKITKKEERERFREVMLTRFEILTSFEDKGFIDSMVKKYAETIRKSTNKSNYTKKLGEALRTVMSQHKQCETLISNLLNVYYNYRVIWHYLNKRNFETKPGATVIGMKHEENENSPDNVLTKIFLMTLDGYTEYVLHNLYLSSPIPSLVDIEAEYSRIMIGFDGYAKMWKEWKHLDPVKYYKLDVSIYDQQSVTPDFQGPTSDFSLIKYIWQLWFIQDMAEMRARKIARLRDWLVKKYVKELYLTNSSETLLLDSLKLPDEFQDLFNFEQTAKLGKLVYNSVLQLKHLKKYRSDDLTDPIARRRLDVMKKYCLNDHLLPEEKRQTIQENVPRKQPLLVQNSFLVAALSPESQQEKIFSPSSIQQDDTEADAETVELIIEEKTASPIEVLSSDVIESTGTEMEIDEEHLEIQNKLNETVDKILEMKEQIVLERKEMPFESHYQELATLQQFHALRVLLTDIENECSRKALIAKDSFKWLVTSSNVHTPALLDTIVKILEQDNDQSITDLYKDLYNPYATNCLKQFKQTDQYLKIVNRNESTESLEPSAPVDPRDVDVAFIKYLLDKGYFVEMIRLLLNNQAYLETKKSRFVLCEYFGNDQNKQYLDDVLHELSRYHFELVGVQKRNALYELVHAPNLDQAEMIDALKQVVSMIVRHFKQGADELVQKENNFANVLEVLRERGQEENAGPIVRSFLMPILSRIMEHGFVGPQQTSFWNKLFKTNTKKPTIWDLIEQTAEHKKYSVKDLGGLGLYEAVTTISTLAEYSVRVPDRVKFYSLISYSLNYGKLKGFVSSVFMDDDAARYYEEGALIRDRFERKRVLQLLDKLSILPFSLNIDTDMVLAPKKNK